MKKEILDLIVEYNIDNVNILEVISSCPPLIQQELVLKLAENNLTLKQAQKVSLLRNILANSDENSKRNKDKFILIKTDVKGMKLTSSTTKIGITIDKNKFNELDSLILQVKKLLK